MSRKEVSRAGLVKAARAGRISNAQGALALHLSVRQFQRVKVRFAAEGAGGLLHRLRGRPSPRRLAAELRARAAVLLQNDKVWSGATNGGRYGRLRAGDRVVTEGSFLLRAEALRNTPSG